MRLEHRRSGRPAVLAIGQAVLTLALLALAWASTSSAVRPMVLALIPIGFSSGLLVPTMTAQSVAAGASIAGLAVTAFGRRTPVPVRSAVCDS